MTPMRNFLAFLTTISLTIGCQNWSYVRTIGYRSDAFWDVRMFVNDVQECIEVCSKQNVCHGFNFEIKTGFCYLHQSATNFTRTENKSYTQYEKICLQSMKGVPKRMVQFFSHVKTFQATNWPKFATIPSNEHLKKYSSVWLQE